MKALTIFQPYASLIADGTKWVENRTWSTTHRGPLAIHAGLGKKYLSADQLAGYPTGCVVAIAELVACMPLDGMQEMSSSQRLPYHDLTLGDILQHEYTEGPWCWVLHDIRKLRSPMRVTGEQGLWEWKDSPSVKLLKRLC